MSRWCGLYCFVIGLWVAPSFATTFEVTPVQLILSSSQKITVLKVTNRSNTASLLQLQLVSWQQRDGKDIYQGSRDIFMTPPLFSLPAHRTQVIRFALKWPCASAEQQTYRVHIREINQRKYKKMGQELHFLMDISLPLFVQPPRIIERFVWSKKQQDSKHIQVRLYNEGNVALFINQFRLMNPQRNSFIAKQSTFAYILPGQAHHWVIKVNTNSQSTDIQSIINGHTKNSVLHAF